LIGEDVYDTIQKLFYVQYQVLPRSFRVSLISSATDASAGSVPAQLYNKSITADRGETGIYKRVSDVRNATPVGTFQSDFLHRQRGTSFHTRHELRGANESGTETSSNNVRFEGDSLVHYRFSSCTASVTIGKSGPGTKIVGFDGAVREALSMKPSGSSCSIRDGNAFGN
jgi:hypothetical protein